MWVKKACCIVFYLVFIAKDFTVNQFLLALRNNAGNYRLTGTETRQIFFSYVCNSKKIKELFASTLNGIVASVKCVSSMVVILNAKFPD